MKLRDYQQECIDAIPNSGSYLIHMATGLGKTVTFANIPRHGRTLVVSHRDELVHQPLKYFDCPTGVEQAGQRSSGEEVISASVQSLVRRLDKFKPDEFDMIIVDEAHHAVAGTYQKILNHFRPRLTLGFTATPNRGDKVRLDNTFSRIIFSRDLRWGIEHGYLSNIFCRRVNIGYDLSAVHSRMGDYAPGELAEAMEGTADAIAQAYNDMATGATLIFAAGVHHAEEIAARISGAVVVTGETKNRAEIVKTFTEGKVPCIVNCMVFTEGTDMPRVETIIVARPTQSDSLYCQMVGRGLRLFAGKKQLNLIDCVGVTGRASLCTAPSLLGIELDSVPTKKRDELQGDLFDLPARAAAASDCPESWIRNVEIVDLWAKEQKYETHNVAWFKMPDGSLTLSLPERRLTIPASDALGNTKTAAGSEVNMQQALDMAFRWLTQYAADARPIWDTTAQKRWGAQAPTDKQVNIIKRRCKGFDTEGLTRGQASMILNRVMGGVAYD